MYKQSELVSLLEDQEKLKFIRDRLLHEIQQNKRYDFVHKILPLINAKNIQNFCRYNNFEYLIGCVEHDIDTCINYILEFGLVSELQIVLNRMTHLTPNTELLRQRLDQETTLDKAIKLSTHIDVPLRNRLYVLDTYSKPGDAPELLKLYNEVSQRDLAYAIHMNIVRYNTLTLLKILSMQRLFKVDSLAMDKVVEVYQLFSEDQKLQGVCRKLFAKKLTPGKLKEVKLFHKFEKLNSLSRNLKSFYQNFRKEETEIEFHNRVLQDPNPTLFNIALQILIDLVNMDQAKNFALERLDYFPNSLAAAKALTYLYEKNRQIGLAISLHEKATNLVYQLGDNSRGHRLKASLGDWEEYENELKSDLDAEHIIGARMPVVAASHGFYMEPAPTTNLKLKSKIIRLTADAKSIRKRIKLNKTGKKSLALFSGDFRTHAMYPIILQILKGLKLQDDVDVTLFASMPKELSDKGTDYIKTFYPLKFLPHFSEASYKEVIDCKFDLAVDLSQNTQYNALRYFQHGIAEKQVTTFWPTAFSSGSKDFDGLICDEYVFRFVPDDYITEPMLKVQHALVVGANQLVQPKLEHSVSDINIGIMCRPMRYSPQLFNLVSMIQRNLPNVRFIFSHYMLNSQRTAEYLKDLLVRHDVDINTIAINSEKMSEVSRHLDAVLDGFPISSPTVTRDFIHSGVPVFVYEGSNDPFTRMSATFMNSLQLNYLMFNDPIDLVEKLRVMSDIRDTFEKDNFRERFTLHEHIMQNNLRDTILKILD